MTSDQKVMRLHEIFRPNTLLTNYYRPIRIFLAVTGFFVSGISLERLSSALSVDRPVVLVGSGRCGSTLLQSILNTNPEFLIWGEHNGFLRQIAAAYYGALHPRFPDRSELTPAQRIKKLRNPRHWPAWDNLSGETEFLNHFRVLLRSLFADPTGQATRWGFKEIRYGRDLKDYALRLMFECFPETRLIVLIREPEPTIFSMLSHWAFAGRREGNLDLDELDQQILTAAHSWTVQYRELHSLARMHALNSFLVRYEDLGHANLYPQLAKFLNTSLFDYRKITARKDASNKTDPTALLIRRRIQLLHREIAATTCEVRSAYGYPSAVNSGRISAAG
jgi:hypothetical protein